MTLLKEKCLKLFSKKNVVLLIIFHLLLFTAMYFFFEDEKITLDNAKLELSGTFLLSPYGGEVEEIFVKPLEEIGKDSPLLRFDPAPFQNVLAQAKTNIERIRLGKKVEDFPISLELKALINLQEEKINKARLDEDLAKKEYEYWVNEEARLLVLIRTPDAKISADDKQKSENAKLMKESLNTRFENASSLRASYEKELQNIKRTAFNSQEVISSEEFWLKQAQNASEALAYTEIKSPFDGIVTKLFVQIGELTVPHQPLAKISLIEKESFSIIAYAKSEDALKLEVGQRAFFEGAKVNFEAELIEIIQEADLYKIKMQAREIPSKAVLEDRGKISIFIE